MINKNNIFYKSVILIVKIVIAVILLDTTYSLFLIFFKEPQERYLCVFTLIFIIFPITFIVFFKNRFIQKHPGFIKPWKILRIIWAIIIILVIALLAFGYFRLLEKNKTAAAIEFINSQKITLDDVMGKNLPPEPDQKLNNSTIAGIDADKNNIRDDVELAIFTKYPDSAKIRAAELQYAQALQLELTQVFNSDTLVSILQKEDLAYQCLGSTIMKKSLSAKDALAALDQKDKEVTDLILNTDLRKKQYSDEYDKYMTGYASLSGPECNIDLSSLPN